MNADVERIGLGDADRRIGSRCRRWQRQRAPLAEPAANPFLRLLGEDSWCRLPPAVQARFSRKMIAGACVSFVGEVTECRMTRLGWLLAQAARLVGGPLPLHRDIGVPACVTVTEDRAGRGQFWTRQYGRHDGFPQVIFSAKRFVGPTGIEEYLGCGFGIALRLAVEHGVLFFLSDHYFVRLGRRRLKLPRWLEPGKLAIGHVDCGGGRFAFTLDLVHSLAGELVHQVAVFADQGED